MTGAPIPNKIVGNILDYKKSGTVLDLGVGWGRNALFLAMAGFKVTGLDKDDNQINAFRQKALDLGVAIIAEKADLRNFNITESYDVIVSTSVLHFITNPKKIIHEMKQHTKTNGLNVISVFTKENPDKNFTYLFEQNELKGYYDDWDTLIYNEYLSDLEQHDNLKPHRHFIAEIIAQKKPEAGDP